MYKKENILLPLSARFPDLTGEQKEALKVPKVETQTFSGLVADSFKSLENDFSLLRTEGRAAVGEFKEYLSNWSKVAEISSISDSLISSIKKVCTFPESSLAFHVGVEELLVAVKKEMGFTEKEKDQTNLELNKLWRERYDMLLNAGYPKWSLDIVEKVLGISRNVLGDSLHDAMLDYAVKGVQGVRSLFSSAYEVAKNLLRKEEDRLIHEELVELSYRKVHKVVGSFDNSSEKNANEREALLKELEKASSDFLSYSKSYFAHNILDNSEKKENKLTPEMLVEGDLSSRPVFDPYPPEWVSMKRRQQEMSKKNT